MAQGPAGVIDIVDLQQNLVLHHADLQRNSGMHHNEIHNAGVHTETENSEVPPDRETAQGPAGVIDIIDLQQNLVLHHANLQRNSGVHHN